MALDSKIAMHSAELYHVRYFYLPKGFSKQLTHFVTGELTVWQR